VYRLLKICDPEHTGNGILHLNGHFSEMVDENDMAKSKNLRKSDTSSVFGPRLSVSDTSMNAAQIALAEQAQANSEVAQALKRHDAGVLDQLIVQYQHRLMRYLLYLTSSREISEDIFQETWMRVLMRGAQFNGNSRFDTWLFTIARNLVVDMRRKRTMASLEELCESHEDERPFEVAAVTPSPLEMCQLRENSGRVAAALLTLEPLYREVLILRFHEELSLEEISKVTRAPLSTVKSRLYRGLAALRPRMLAQEQRPVLDQPSA
jgi:RNA polymerase sigma-70 factor (ECF subfamily)